MIQVTCEFRCLLENPCMPQAAPTSAAVSSQDCLHPQRAESSASISPCNGMCEPWNSPETSCPKSSGHSSRSNFRSVSHHHSQSQRQLAHVLRHQVVGKSVLRSEALGFLDLLFFRFMGLNSPTFRYILKKKNQKKLFSLFCQSLKP